jgi:hypothetical protein
MVLNRAPPEAHTAFRLSRELLAEVDALCQRLDLTRSQLFRRGIAKYTSANMSASMSRRLRTRYRLSKLSL